MIHNLICNYCNEPFQTINKPRQGYCSISCGARGHAPSDINIFESLNDTSVYALGLIWSDGNLALKTFKNGEQGGKLTISSTDYEEIEKLRQIITPNKKLYSQKPKGTGCTPPGDHYKWCHQIITQDFEIIRELLGYGLIPAKSKTMQWPYGITHKYIWSFIRGYFDGDGCVYKAIQQGKYHYLTVKFTCGSMDFLESFKKILLQEGIESKIGIDNRSGTPWLQVHRQDSIRKLYKNMYKDTTLHFSRKKSIFDTHYNQYTNLPVL